MKEVILVDPLSSIWGPETQKAAAVPHSDASAGLGVSC